MQKLFIDTANIEDIKKYHSLGLISGVTTNPSLIAKEPKQNFDKLVYEIWDYCSYNNLSFNIEVFATKPKEIIKQAFALHNNLLKTNITKQDLLYIKIPIGVEEIFCIKHLSDNWININCTVGYTAIQMQLAILAGAKYISIFYNRAKDFNIDSLKSIRQIRSFIDKNNLNTKIIACSIRNPSDISDVWDEGAHIVTCGPKIINEGLFHEGSEKSVQDFIKNFNNWNTETF